LSRGGEFGLEKIVKRKADGPGSERAAEGRGGWVRTLRNAGKLALGRGFQAGCSLAYLAFAAQALGSEAFGALVLLHGFALATAQLARFKTPDVAVSFGAGPLQNGGGERLRVVLSFSVVLDAIGCLVAAVLVGAFARPASGWLGLAPEAAEWAVPYGLAVVLCVNATGWATGVLRLLDRFGAIAALSALEPALRLAGAAAVFGTGGGLPRFLLAWFAALFVSRTATLWCAARATARDTPLGAWPFSVRAALQGGSRMARFALGTQWNLSLKLADRHIPTLLVGGLLGPSGAGLFRVAQQFSDVLLRSNAKLLSPAIYPQLARLTADRRWRDRRAMIARLTAIGAGAFGVLFAALAVFGEALIAVVAGAEFVAAYPAMVWLAFGGVLTGLFFALEPLLLATDGVKRVVASNAAALVVYLGALVLLLDALGLVGAGIAASLHAAARGAMMFLGARSRLFAQDAGDGTSDGGCRAAG